MAVAAVGLDLLLQLRNGSVLVCRFNRIKRIKRTCPVSIQVYVIDGSFQAFSNGRQPADSIIVRFRNCSEDHLLTLRRRTRRQSVRQRGG